MGLNDIRLNSSLVASLYPNSLVETTSSETIFPEIKNEESEWKYLGDNEKNILLVVNYTTSTHLPDDELSFLTTILSACKLSLADVAIVNRQNYLETNYKDLTDHFASKIILLFDIDPANFGLPVTFPHFQVQSFANNKFLYIPSLKECSGDKLLKSKLWVCLQSIFGIK